MLDDLYMVRSIYSKHDFLGLRENSYETGAGHDAAGSRRVPPVFLGVLANTSV